MYRNGQNRLVIVIFFLIVVSALFWLMIRSKRGSSPPTSSTSSSIQAEEKMEVSYEALEKAWSEAKKMKEKSPPVPPGPMPPTNMPLTNQPFSPEKMPPAVQKWAAAHTKEMGTKEAKVRVDAFLPLEACQGPTAMTLEKLAKEYKGRLYVRVYPLYGPAAGQVGVHCATIFINGKNYTNVDGKEVVLGSLVTHNVSLVEKAIKKAIGEAYGVPQQGGNK